MKGSVSLKLYLLLSGSIFFLVGVLHLLRLVYHWPLVLGTYPVPHALSFIGFPVATGYAIWAFSLCRK